MPRFCGRACVKGSFGHKQYIVSIAKKVSSQPSKRLSEAELKRLLSVVVNQNYNVYKQYTRASIKLESMQLLVLVLSVALVAALTCLVVIVRV